MGERLIGYEFEYTGCAPEKMASMLADLYSSEVKKVSEVVFKVPSPYGDFKIEFDSSVLKEKKYEKILSDLGIELSNQKSDQLLKLLMQLSQWIVPYEIVSPPVPENKIEEIELLSSKARSLILESRNIKSPVVPCGFHINPEVKNREPQHILNIIRSFYLFFNSYENVDRIRKWSGYISAYPKKYANLIFEADYQPSQEELIRDYCQYNPTRNVALDMLPLFSFLNPQLVKSFGQIEHHLVKPRPTYHYRLENCHLEEEGWSPKEKWQHWLEIEKQAEKPDLLVKAYYESQA